MADDSTTTSSARLPSPLRAIQEQHGAAFLKYGATPADPAAVEIVETFGPYEAEYAAMRKGVGIFDAAQLGLVEVRGADRAAFLHRMVTHEVRSLGPGQGRRAFLLGKTGRIVADMIILHEAERTLLVTDVFQAALLPAELEKYIFTEDVPLADQSGAFVHLAMHGPAGAALMAGVGEGSGVNAAELAPLGHGAITIAGQPCVLYRRDETGSLGLHLIVPRAGALAVYQALAGAVGGLTPTVEGGVIRSIRGRGIGWAAYNTARIEAGTPLFHIDFGPDSLPHETGVLSDTVSFTKGCYLGQEIVARMQNLGHPKRVLVGWRLADDRLPIAGSQVLAAGQIVGAVTSSTLSPLLGGIAIGFAMVKWGSHQPSGIVDVPAEGTMVPAKVQGLSFL